MFQFGEIADKIVHYYYYISGRRLMLQSVVWWWWVRGERVFAGFSVEAFPVRSVGER